MTDILTANRAKIESALGLLEGRMARTPHDTYTGYGCSSPASCTRCNILYVAKTLRDLLATTEETLPTNG